MNENSTSTEQEGRRRVDIENVILEIDAGRFTVKRTVGESVVVEAEIFADGHDSLSAALKIRAKQESESGETSMNKSRKNVRTHFSLAPPHPHRARL